MALVSPGVEVNIIDQSQYLPTSANSVPFIILATAQNKADASGTAVASATTKANANKLYQVTSQRDLVTLFGSPFFYKTTNGTPIHGYELNEYGLMAAYSLLGSTNNCYILRADVDLASLVGRVTRPAGEPTNGTYWLDTANTAWGIYEFNATTGKFVAKTPILVTDSQMEGQVPMDIIGNKGDYAVLPTQATDGLLSKHTYFLKSPATNTWVALGTPEWKNTISFAKGVVTSAPYSLPSGTLTIDFGGVFSRDIVVTSGDTPTDLAGYINDLGVNELSADAANGVINLYYGHYGQNLAITLSDDSTILETLNLNPDSQTNSRTFYAPDIFFGNSSQMPLWTASQARPHPTGSVWVKTSAAGNGLDLVMSKYSTTTGAWSTVNLPVYNTDAAASFNLDSSGGKAIPAGTLYANLNSRSLSPDSALSVYERTVAGATIATGTNTAPDFQSGLTLGIIISIPGSTTAPLYTLTTTPANGVSGNGDAASFVRDWTALGIPYTTAIVTDSGAIQISHTEGGEIYLSDKDTNNTTTGLLSALGFTFSTAGVKRGTPAIFTSTTKQHYKIERGGLDITGSFSGTPGTFTITVSGADYTFTQPTSPGTGAGYEVGDILTFAGSTLGGEDVTNDLKLTVQETAFNTNDGVTRLSFHSGVVATDAIYSTQISNWQLISYTPSLTAPTTKPAADTRWYFSVVDQVDIMVNKGGVWKGYRNVAFDAAGHPTSSTSGAGATDIAGPIIAATAPTTQSDGITALAYGDLWIDSSDLENYPLLSRWEAVEGVDQWVKIDTADQTSSSGVLFADARWGAAGVDPVNDAIPSIASLLTENNIDLDCPSASLYPQGMLLFNTRRSGYNVKQFKANYFNGIDFPGQSLPAIAYTWVSESGLKSDGSAYMGRKAQRNLIVQSLKSAVNTNMSIREEDTFFNLISAPGYPELQPDMITLNNDRHNTAFIVGDTPLRLSDQATELTAWANNSNNATSTGEVGLVTRDTYLGVFYPSGITTDLTGNQIVVPASHMMLRTFLRNDQIAYPWLAAAGTRRGNIDNATNIGYIDAATGEFQTVKNRMSIRDVLYQNEINPLAFFTGIGLLNYGNKSSYASSSALDRINVARLVAYIRNRLQVAARPFVFEPNDNLTRAQLTGVVQSLFIDLVSKRGLYDYLVVCDTSNNTPARIDRNELWIDIAIKPVKAAEFVYIPVRVLNTGASLK